MDLPLLLKKADAACYRARKLQSMLLSELLKAVWDSRSKMTKKFKVQEHLAYSFSTLRRKLNFMSDSSRFKRWFSCKYNVVFCRRRLKMDDPNFFEMEDDYDIPDEAENSDHNPVDESDDETLQDPDYQPHPYEYGSDSDAEGEEVIKKLSRKEKEALMNTPFPKEGEKYNESYLPLFKLMLQYLKKRQAAHKRHIGRKNPSPEAIDRALESSFAHQIDNDNDYYGTGIQHLLL